MKTIWKYKLRIEDRQLVEMPSKANLLSAGLQPHPHGFDVCLWAMVDTDNPMIRRQVWIVGTGNPIGLSPSVKFVGTVIDVPFVWHVFDGGELPNE